MNKALIAELEAAALGVAEIHRREQASYADLVAAEKRREEARKAVHAALGRAASIIFECWQASHQAARADERRRCVEELREEAERRKRRRSVDSFAVAFREAAALLEKP